ncbi:unnamed protein product [Cuscuta epithymum]|uniref:DUF3615 domain-containing protein n=2 Tax=Cuscuta epithymum TaxID=186058 RepID=A0AAV0GFY6_9ASTE|nr:unnamed protein product [Cuscuta epithymum]
MVKTSEAYNLRSRTIYKSHVRPRGKPVKYSGGYGPPLIQWSAKDLEIMDRRDRRLAELALDYYHNTYKDGVTYEVVEVMRSNQFALPDTEKYIKAHTNFIAKPKNSNGPSLLFFVETSYPNLIGRRLDARTTTVHVCYMLGAVGEVDTGLNGCLACRGTRGPALHHPHDGVFDIGYEMYRLR